MSEPPSSRPWLALLAGAVLGAAGALLLSPRSGRENRRRFSRWLKTWEGLGKNPSAPSETPLHKRAAPIKREVKNATKKNGDRFS